MLKKWSNEYIFTKNILFLRLLPVKITYNMSQRLNLEDIAPVKKLSEAFSHAGHDYIFSHLVFNGHEQGQIPEVYSFEGLTIIVVLKGEITVTINSAEYVMKEKSISVVGSNSILSTPKVPEVELYTLFLSSEFISSIHFDINVINPRHMLDAGPVTILDDKETVLISRFLELLHYVAVDNSGLPTQLDVLSRSIGRSLVSSLLYQITLISEKYSLISHQSQDSVASRSRKINYVHDFMHLLQQYYRSERSVGFYASKLCISPKYLSLLVREATGQTAAAIIDRFVISEAKNLLRFSGLTIQQVSYQLNFPNQSAFGKYFKHLTGFSPTTFRSI